MINLKALDMSGLEQFVCEMRWEKYRSKQLFAWIWQKGVADIDLMTNIARPKRQELKDKSYVSELKLLRQTRSHDGSVKFLFGLEDGLSIETVFIPEAPRRTVCVSTQVGCPLKCAICRTGQLGFKRNLRFYEIADQVLQTRKLVRSAGIGAEQVITNVVMMGMGEPLLNFEEVVRAADILNHDLGLAIGARHITISTSGIPDGIRRLADYPKQYKLAVSLNAVDDATRTRLMPVNRKYPLSVLLDAIRYYTNKTHRRVTFEYVLIKGVNDSPLAARRLINLIRRVPCKINLIPFNAGPGVPYESPTRDAVEKFAAILYPELPAVTIRKSKGSDISAACGQLAGSEA